MGTQTDRPVPKTIQSLRDRTERLRRAAQEWEDAVYAFGHDLEALESEPDVDEDNEDDEARTAESAARDCAEIVRDALCYLPH